MKITIDIKDGRIIFADTNYLTVRKRKEAASKFEKRGFEIKEDKEILADLSAKFKATPPTEQQIYEGYLSLMKKQNAEEKQRMAGENREEFYEELTRLCCRWLIKGTAAIEYKEISQEEFQNLPFFAADYLANNLFSEEEQGFLVVAPE